jgi:nicotinamidase-related amidase
VRFTAHAALDLGYDLTLIEDAHTTSDFEWDHGMLLAANIIDEQNASLSNLEMPGRKAQIVPSAKFV